MATTQWKRNDLVETLVKSKTRGSMYWLPARVMKSSDRNCDLKILTSTADRFGIKSLNAAVTLDKIRPIADVALGEKVKVDENKIGHVRWVGTDPVFGNAKETWYGVELDRGRGFSDGHWKNKRFFTCDRWHGMFVKRERIMSMKPASSVRPNTATSPPRTKSARANLDDYKQPTKAAKAAAAPADVPKSASNQAPLTLDNVADEQKYAPSPLSPRLKTEEEKELRQTFKFFDKKKDQRIDAAELKQVMKQLGSEIDDLGVRLLMSEFDLNKSGSIEWSEFLLMMKQLGGVTVADVRGRGNNLDIG